MGKMDQIVERPRPFDFPVDSETRELYARVQNGTMSETEFFKLTHRDGLIEGFLSIDGFETILSAYLEQGTHGTLIAVDLDYFKIFNDSEGHSAGDELLKLAGEILYTHTRTTEADEKIQEKRKKMHASLDILARGGDEFLIFLVESELNDAAEAAKRIRIAIEVRAKKKFPNFDRNQTMSLGLSQAKKSDAVKSLRQRADEALYEAKKGRGSLNPSDSVALF